MIDIDKFIASLLKSKRKPLTYINDEKVVLVSYDAIVQALEEQGLEFRDGSIVKTNPLHKIHPDKWYMCLKEEMGGDCIDGYVAFEKGKIYKGEDILKEYSKEDIKKYYLKSFRLATLNEEVNQNLCSSSSKKTEPSIPEIVEEHFDELLEDKSNPDNLHQYLYGDDSILGKVRAEIKRRYEHHLGCMERSRDDTYPEISHAHHRVIKDELFEILCFLDVLEGKSDVSEANFGKISKD